MCLKVALVGCGKIEDGHIEEIRKMPERARVVAVCDLEPLMAEQISGLRQWAKGRARSATTQTSERKVRRIAA